MVKVFVYGTLKSNHGNNSLLSDSELIGEASTVKKLPLLNLNHLPCLFNTEDEAAHHVRGEVYEVDSNTLYYLDLLEGHPYHYKRESIHVLLNGTEITCEAYFLPSSILDTLRETCHLTYLESY